ncbi:MAG: hypothetical protein R6U44_07140 [Archaeoglobaceae archaeon]
MPNIDAIFKDVEDLKQKVDRVEKMLETLIEIHTDEFYEVRGEYIEKLEKIKKEGEFEEFSNTEELRKLIEED